MSSNSKEVVTVYEAKTPEEISACWPVIKVLRPHLIEPQMVDRVIVQRANEFYRLMYTKDEDKGHVTAIMGFRIHNCLWSGKTLYIDDLCTLPEAKCQGLGSRLLDWAKATAQEQHCEAMSLDSGYNRIDAHRLYLNKRFQLACHHFHMNL